MAEKEATTKKTPTRKTLMQLQSETTVRDPAAHAKNQITELDKTAKRSLDKRSKCTLQIEQDSKELAQIEEQIQRIKHRYDPLVQHLADLKEKRAMVLQTLNSCVAEEKKIMGDTLGTVHVRRKEDSKLRKTMASQKLEQTRGFGMGPDSTFHQGGNKSSTMRKTGLNSLNNTGKSEIR